MATIPNRYLEDLTGNNPSNKVVDDVYRLSTKDVRAVATRYGPFFGDSVVIYDDDNNVLLERNVDYSLVGLLPELTQRTGKGIYDAIMIVKKNMSSNVRLEYQVVGGNYHNQANTLSQITEALLQDTRPVDWMDIVNTPSKFPPSLHSHWLQDLVGFGPIVASIDRIANAITIGQAPIFNFLLSYMAKSSNSSGLNSESAATLQDLIDGTADDKYITPEALKQFLDLFHFTSIELSPIVTKMQAGKRKMFTVTVNNNPAIKTLYWKLDTTLSDESYFVQTSGVLDIVDGEVTFNVTIKPDADFNNKSFKILILKEPEADVHFIKTKNINITESILVEDDPYSSETMTKLYSMCCLVDPINMNPMGYFMLDK